MRADLGRVAPPEPLTDEERRLLLEMLKAGTFPTPRLKRLAADAQEKLAAGVG